MIYLCEGCAEVAAKTAHHRSYSNYSMCHVSIYGVNKSQFHPRMTLLVKAMGIVQTISQVHQCGLYNPPGVLSL